MVKDMGMSRCSNIDRILKIALMVSTISFPVWSQTTPSQPAAGTGTNQPTNSAPLTLTLQDALARARKNNPEYRAAVTEFGLAREDRVQSRAALLPNVNYNTSFLYTQGNGTPTGKFVGANGVHEYLSQGNIHQEISLQNLADYRRTAAALAVAQARAEIAARGLVVTVVQAYYGFVVAQRKYATQQRAAAEAQNFFDISQKLERGGEVAHSDVIKAEIQFQQQQRDLQQAELEMNRTRLELAVLVFPDFNENFSVVDDLQTPEPLLHSRKSKPLPRVKIPISVLPLPLCRQPIRKSPLPGMGSYHPYLWIIFTASTPIDSQLAVSIRPQDCRFIIWGTQP